MIPPPGGVAALGALLGDRVLDVEDLTRPWATDTRTELVTLAGGDRVVVQRGGGDRASRAAIARRLQLGRALGEAAPWLPVPEVLGGDPRAEVPFAVTRYVAGSPGNTLLDDDAGAVLLGRLGGDLAGRLARVPVRGLGLPRTWADPERLRAAAGRWLDAASVDLAPGVASRARGTVEQVPTLFGGAAPVFAHGDLVPVNLVVRDDAIAGLLDLERARLAHPLFDAAWWRLIVRHHHRDRFGAVWTAFEAAFSAVSETPLDTAVLDLLGTLACLEMVAATPVRSGARAEWARRLEAAIADPRA